MLFNETETRSRFKEGGARVLFGRLTGIENKLKVTKGER